MLRHVRKLRDAYVGGVLKITDELGERVIAGRARFVQPDTLEVLFVRWKKDAKVSKSCSIILLSDML
jgi:pyruvate/2-oxoglutarate dehydrogenase complex dihydrolipoamide dehydrogenase (E3) component